jgi:hypothetical protein
MRAFEGQHSDNVAIKRSRDQKILLLRQLREQFGALKPTVAPGIRAAMAKRISDLEGELGGAANGGSSNGNAKPARGRNG